MFGMMAVTGLLGLDTVVFDISIGSTALFLGANFIPTNADSLPESDLDLLPAPPPVDIFNSSNACFESAFSTDSSLRPHSKHTLSASIMEEPQRWKNNICLPDINEPGGHYRLDCVNEKALKIVPDSCEKEDEKGTLDYQI